VCVIVLQRKCQKILTRAVSSYVCYTILTQINWLLRGTPVYYRPTGYSPERRD